MANQVVRVGNVGQGLTPFAFEELTVTTAEKVLTASTYTPSGTAPAKAAVVQVQTNDVRYRGDGTAASATVGHLAAATDVIVLESTLAIAQASFWSDTGAGGDATIAVTYYR